MVINVYRVEGDGAEGPSDASEDNHLVVLLAWLCCFVGLVFLNLSYLKSEVNVNSPC